MRYLENRTEVKYTKCKFPMISIGNTGASLNVFAQQLIPVGFWGVKLLVSDEGNWIEIVENGSDDTTFGLSKTQGIRINGIILGQFFGFAQMELVKTDVLNKYKLVHIDNND